MSDIDLLRMTQRISGEFRRKFHVILDQSEYEGLRGSGRLLHVLESSDDMPQKELARRLEIRPQSLTEALLKLEQAGYIVRRRSEKDKREQYVSITELGRERGRQLLGHRECVANEIFAVLDDAEKEQINYLLNKVVEQFNKPREE